ncbi:hypothetical protein [Microbispora sp. KK1-11]|uniref:hypothetical protein n=1 Tax=Microbispora sp. KK1-11 TaxID=2053005 RepID=UPI001157D945|nr:hypothetical protein [Microbispora sp. KK1-11]TQS29123.1 hypothetical protein FLW16_12315 [Microbispora sp. KK1-11]
MAAPVSPASAQFIDATFWAQEITNRWTDLYAGWTSYTPTWTGSTSNPSLGNGTITAAYKRADTAKTASIRIRLAAGSTTTYGSGQWSFSLPPGLAPVTIQAISGHILDASSTNRWACTAYIAAATGVERIAVDGSLGVSGLIPMTWAVSDQLLLAGTFEIS